MFTQEFIDNLKSKKTMIVLLVLGAMILSLVFSFVQTFEYECDASLYVIQNQDGLLAKDAYAAAKSAEKLAKNMSQMVYTGTFMERVFETNYGVGRDILPVEENKKRKEWNKKIETYVVPETGILDIKVYDKDKVMVEKIAQAIIYVLVTEGADFHGGGDEVEVKIADAPIVSKYPTRPNIALNLGIALIMGLIVSIVIVFLTTQGEEGIFETHNKKYHQDNLAELELITNQIKPLYGGLDSMSRKLDFLTHRNDENNFQEISKNVNDKLDLVREEFYDLVVEQKNNLASNVLNLKNEVTSQVNSMRDDLAILASKLSELNQEVDLSGIEDGLNQNKAEIKGVIDEIKKMALVESVREVIAKHITTDQNDLVKIENQLANLATKDNIRLVIEKQKENALNPSIFENIIVKLENLAIQKPQDNSEVLVGLENINQQLKGILEDQAQLDDNNALNLIAQKIDQLIEKENHIQHRLQELKQTDQELGQINDKINQLGQREVVTKDDLEQLLIRQNELLNRENERNNKYKAEADKIRQNLAQLEGKLGNYVTKDKLDSLTATQDQFLSKNDLRRLIQGDIEPPQKLASQVKSNEIEDRSNFQSRLN
jgi:capsular polysaccharide biosynthesis protein